MTAIRPLIPFIEALPAGLPGAALPRVAAIRARAAGAYRQRGLPVAKVEAWKYTRLKDLEARPYSVTGVPGVLAGVPETDLPGPAVRIVIADGRFDAAHSDAALPDGVTLVPLAQALAAGDPAVLAVLERAGDYEGAPMEALADAFLADGAVLSVAPGVALASRIEVTSAVSDAAGPRLVFPRLVLVLGAGASATLVERYVGPAEAPYAVDAVTDAVLGAGANLRHYAAQTEGEGATHVSLVRASLAAGAGYEGFVLQLGGRTARREVRLSLDGPGAKGRINGAYAVRGGGHCDTTTVVVHGAEETFSDQVFKGLAADRGRGVFQGKILVKRDSQRIVGNQLHKALLLSKTAEIDCKPELLIFADDVKCSHGAAVGELDEEQLFFMRSRGIPREEARNLLIHAFLGEAFDLMSDETVRQAFVARINAWLGGLEAK